MNTRVVILAGGKGSRLKKVIEDQPKAMAVVAGKPFLEHQLLFFKAQGCRQFLLCTGHLSRSIQDYFQNGRSWGIEIHYSVENQALGTAGALALAKDQIGDFPVIVANGDTLLDGLDVQSFLDFHKKKLRESRAAGTVATVKVENSASYGLIQIDAKTACIQKFMEKNINRAGGYVSAGIYILEREVLESLPKKACSLERDIFPDLVGQKKLWAYENSGFFWDIGTPESYQTFKDYWERKLP